MSNDLQLWQLILEASLMVKAVMGILLAASDAAHEALVAALSPGNRHWAAAAPHLFAFVALPDQAPTMALRCLTRVSADAVASEDVLETSVPMLKQAPVSKFVF